MCLCVSVCVHGVLNVKLVSLACMPNDPKSGKCKNGICVCMCLCTFIFLCVWCVPFINSVSLACMPNKPKSAKCEFFKKICNFKNINDRCIIYSLWVVPSIDA